MLWPNEKGISFLIFCSSSLPLWFIPSLFGMARSLALSSVCKLMELCLSAGMVVVVLRKEVCGACRKRSRVDPTAPPPPNQPNNITGNMPTGSDRKKGRKKEQRCLFTRLLVVVVVYFDLWLNSVFFPRRHPGPLLPHNLGDDQGVSPCLTCLQLWFLLYMFDVS
jgi:hypothetical protein